MKHLMKSDLSCDNNHQTDCPTFLTQETQESSFRYLAVKITELASEHNEAGLLIAGAISTAIVIYVVIDSAIKLIKVLKK